MSTSTYMIPDDLLARCVGREDLVRRVLTAYLTQLNGDLGQLQKDIESQGFDEVAKVAHRLKGASANVSATEIQRQAERLELGARAEAGDQILATLEQLQRDCDSFITLTSDFVAI